MGFLAGGVVTQTGAGRVIFEEAAAAVDGGQRHEVEKAHAHTAHEQALALADAVHLLLNRVAGRDVGQARFGKGLLCRGRGGQHPAGGDHGGVGVDQRAICKQDRVAASVAVQRHRAGLVLNHGDRVRQLGQRNLPHPAQVLAIQRTRRIRFRSRHTDFSVEGAGDGRRVVADKRMREFAAKRLDPLKHGGAFEHRCGDGRAGLSEQGYRASQGVHAQCAGLFGVPDAAGTELGVVDDVQRQWCSATVVEEGCDALGDGDASRSCSDDGDVCFHSDVPPRFR